MSRKKKSRSLKDRLGIKTGSRKTFISKGDKGKIPSKNRLAKHKNRSKSAYAKFLAENQRQDTSAGQHPGKPAKVDGPDLQSAADTELQTRDESDTADFDELSGDELLDRFERS